MKKRTVILLLSTALAVSSALAGCGGNDEKKASISEQGASSTDEEKAGNGSDQKENADKGAPEQEVPESEAAISGDGSKPEEDTSVNQNNAGEKAVPETDANAPQAEEQKEKKVVMYTTVNLILRKKGNMDAEKIEILPVNTKVTVLKKGKEWYKVKASGKKGFVFAEYLTKSKEEAKEAAAQAAEAEAQAAAEAAAQAAAQNTYSAPQNTAPSGGGKTEVSREDYPDCDGSGHGYSEIHYSDGSTEIVEY